ncbi:peptide chain release factor N(5)-glutamine methyltransferase [Olivibacter sp. SDN3]|uniref:peptide chain release factor N(5)-glutamine methyltransferase n=1 Tax=Olivibacter sp. SDN3 TaxID=2764720 RepID=UPI001651282C|nr:peptide chain release factor N(5)-glutamine methyltransferase [Olivibacter sp. SDN3]QNL48605.1 peptide chain release factor N(5)-glutamine methyltransferase [Olivibacter sp. SDN3]
MQQLNHLKKEFIDKLSPLYPVSEIESLFAQVLEDALQLKRKDYLLDKSFTLSAAGLEKIKKISDRLLKGEPLQYILGVAWFMGLHLKVTEKVLIPRPETEELVDLIIQDHSSSIDQPLQIIDIGTGSGCIPSALKAHLRDAQVWAVDISREALEIAKYNAAKHHTSINFMLADILDWEFVFQDGQKFDIIVSNPPYITPGEKEEMHPNVLQFEPHLALFVEEKAPLLFYETIASFALEHLQPKGKLYFEINSNYGVEVKNLLYKKGFKVVRLLQDMQGADRMISASF